jgi:hypothetical protein
MTGNFADNGDFHAIEGIFFMPQICDMGLSEGRRAEDFFALKNPTAFAGFEPANLGTKGQHATSRTLKPLRIPSTRQCHSSEHEDSHCVQFLLVLVHAVFKLGIHSKR